MPVANSAARDQAIVDSRQRIINGIAETARDLQDRIDLALRYVDRDSIVRDILTAGTDQ